MKKKQKHFQKILMQKTACKTQTLYVLLVFLLIIKALLITFGIYCLL